MTRLLRIPRLPRPAAAVLAGIVLFVVPAAADAPKEQYERFDGDSTTIRDFYTKLEWDRRGVLGNVTFAGATGGCPTVASLENVGRLPTVKELLTIIDEQPHQEYEFGKLVPKSIDALAFADTPADLPFWTSTPAPGTDMFWTVSFQTGKMEPRERSTKANARCVR